MKTVIISSMVGPYDGPINDAEIWGVNRTYEHQKGISRIYILDDLSGFQALKIDTTVPDAVNALGVPVYMQDVTPEIGRSCKYPIEKMVAHFGVDYFTSTPSYMLAHAIYLGFERIVLAHFMNQPLCDDYGDQKPCLDFWCGLAVGRGIQVQISGDSHLCRPFPWQGRRYGYSEPRPNIKVLINAGFIEAGEGTDANEYETIGRQKVLAQ